jgi:PAS domain S-box-containing protein
MNTQYYQLILDNISDIAWFIDKDGKFVVVNNAFLDLYKIKKSDIIGKTYFDILDSSTADKYNKQNLSVISTRQQLVHETYVELENEGWLEFKWYETILSPAIDPTTHDCVGIVGLGRDISERKQKLQKLREQQEWLKVYFELPIIGMAIITESSQWLNVNEKFCHTLGYSYQELMNTKLVDLISGTSKDEFTQALHGLSQSNLDHVDLELALYRRSGDTVYVHLMIHVIHKVDEEQNQFVIMMEDVTEKRQIEQKLHLANRVIDSSSEAIMITDHRSEIVRVNEAFTTLTGYEEKEVLGRNPRLLQSGRNTKEFYQKMWDSITSTGSWQGEMWDRRKDGSTYPKWMNISSIVRPETQKVSHYVALFSDMTERKRAENKIRYMVYHDTLTGLPNRTLL